MAGLKLLLTGATGYIGGSILHVLLSSDSPSIKDLQISVLVRKRSEALANLGVNQIVFKDLDDSETITKAASEHDIVIHAASGFHTGSARSLVLGLGQRMKQTGKQTYYIHTSGTSNLADRPISTGFIESRHFSDSDDDLYAYLKAREEGEIYAQRTSDLTVVETGKETGVQTYIIMSPTIYGIGSGTANRTSVQIPTLMRSALKNGKAEVIGDGEAEWDYVHIDDVSKLYEILLSRILKGDHVASGEKGIFFSGTGRFQWKEMSSKIGKAGYELDLLKSPEVESLSLEEAAGRWLGGNAKLVELGLASNSRTTSTIAPGWGWKPQKTAIDWDRNFVEEFKLIAAAQ